MSLRSIAPERLHGDVRLRIYRDDDLLWESSQRAKQGPLSFFWEGKTNKGKSVDGGRLNAKLAFVDARGKSRHNVEHPFVHDNPETQHANFGEVQGALRDESNVALANTTVELVDQAGNVVQRVRSTRSGQYRFKNVDEGKYKVRVGKKGFRGWEGNVSTSKAHESQADVQITQH